jgi:hypothetical protein
VMGRCGVELRHAGAGEVAGAAEETDAGQVEAGGRRASSAAMTGRGVADCEALTKRGAGPALAGGPALVSL